MEAKKKNTPGVVVRHGRSCRTRSAGNCNCDPLYEAWVYSKKDGTKIRKSFPTLAAARGWRTDAMKAVKDKRLRAPTTKTLRQEIDEWLTGASEGRILSKRERPYKPAVIRNYELALRLRVLPALGDRRLADIDLADLLELKEQLVGQGCSGSTIRNTFVPLQALYRRARLLGVVPIDPTVDLPLPTSGERDRAATLGEAEALIATLPDAVTCGLWASAFFAGLRRGELRALRVGDVDLEGGRFTDRQKKPIEVGALRVEHGWDDKEGEIDPKSIAGKRIVFVADALKPHLRPLIDGRAADEFVFGAGSVAPFEPRAVTRRAERAWDAIDKARKEKWVEAGAKKDDEPAPLDRFTLHEGRHSFSTWLSNAGIPDSSADAFMGHSSGSVRERYRHVQADQIKTDAQRFDAYIGGVAAGKVVAIDAAAPSRARAAS